MIAIAKICFCLKKLYCYPPVSKASREVANFRKSKNDAPMLPILSVSLLLRANAASLSLSPPYLYSCKVAP